jgi:WhiB family redox-sensing transcriptional regulator
VVAETHGPPDLPNAACREQDPAIFYAMDDSTGDRKVATARARTVCAGCPDRGPCLTWALRFERHGVWGGTSPVQRRRLRQQRGIPAPESPLDRKRARRAG